ncbi:hypothetical protein BLNAU_10200 [Blattamonas nauphoetae]|uniref:Uncharacterized protein n=1 Tax=Blattamonas nauphoetae TaxID=2049346 RepID=A0ABQ9XTR2_9EUKA|nr:hypothetical protein BLNAU_10200 [Blattamonas nauphoetae]
MISTADLIAYVASFCSTEDEQTPAVLPGEWLTCEWFGNGGFIEGGDFSIITSDPEASELVEDSGLSLFLLKLLANGMTLETTCLMASGIVLHDDLKVHVRPFIEMDDSSPLLSFHDSSKIPLAGSILRTFVLLLVSNSSNPHPAYLTRITALSSRYHLGSRSGEDILIVISNAHRPIAQ